MSKIKEEYKDLGKSLKSVIRFLEDDPGIDTIEMRMPNRRIVISHFTSKEGEFYKFIFQRAVPKEHLESIKKDIAENPIAGGSLVRNKILMSEIILSREAYEALIVGFFKLENPDMTANMKVVITENN